MNKVLVKYSEDYADEFQVSGFCVMTREKWENYVKRANEAVWPQCQYFGTNEGVQWDSAEDHLDAFNVVDITDGEAAFLEKNFQGYGEMGHCLMLDEFPSTPRELY